MQPTPSLFNSVACIVCDHVMPPRIDATHCERCGSHWLDARYDYVAVSQRWPQALTGRRADLWRYAELLPLSAEGHVSMGEGWTPLYEANRLGAELGHSGLYIKDERRGPTNSFKDRQASLAVSALQQLGIQEAVIASTGNAAVAYAAYCARAGIRLWVFVTSLVPQEKMREMSLYGAEVIKVTGTYDQAKVVAAQFAERRGLHFERGAKAVVGKESMKTIAFEIAEQLNWQAPDWYIQAVSGGIGPVGVWKGFAELHQAGLIPQMPRLAVVQVDGCAPMVQAFAARKPEAEPVEPRTNITVLSTGEPGFAYTYLYRAVTSNGGTMISVPEDDAFKAMARLARLEGVSVEPATAVAFAGLLAMFEQELIMPDQRVVVNASGHTMPVEKFMLGGQHIVDIAVRSPLAERWGLPEEGLGAALEHLDEKVTSIVIIDDSPRDSRLIRRLLQRYKVYRIYEANNPHEGIELVRDRQPDLVVLDLMMPGLNGFDILERLKGDPRTAHIPVIVVSGKSLTQRERLQLEEQTASLWIKGSYRVNDLVEHIVSQLGDALDEAGGVPLTANGQGKEQAQAAEALAPVRSFNILLIEDNPLDVRLLRRTLEQNSLFALKEAHSGEQALRLLSQEQPDLILLDLMLPDTDGVTLLEQIRALPTAAGVPVVVLTAKDISSREQAVLSRHTRLIWAKGAVDRATLREEIVQVLLSADKHEQ